jgi:cold shock CspA family protein
LHEEQIIGDESVEPQPGQKIRFHVKPAPKGPEALNAELTAFPPEPATTASLE